MSAPDPERCGEYGCEAPAKYRVGEAPTCEEHREAFYRAALRLAEIQRPPRRRGRWAS